jgi:hypothetical protein
MYRFVASLIAGTLIFCLWLAVFPGPDESPNEHAGRSYPIDRVQAARRQQAQNEAVGKLRIGMKEEASQSQPAPSPRNAAFVVFLSLLYGRK